MHSDTEVRNLAWGEDGDSKNWRRRTGFFFQHDRFEVHRPFNLRFVLRITFDFHIGDFAAVATCTQ